LQLGAVHRGKRDPKGNAIREERDKKKEARNVERKKPDKTDNAQPTTDNKFFIY